MTDRLPWMEPLYAHQDAKTTQAVDESTAGLRAVNADLLAALEALADEWYGLWVSSHDKFTPLQIEWAQRVEAAARNAIDKARGIEVKG